MPPAERRGHYAPRQFQYYKEWSAGGEENMIKFERCPRLAEDGECRSSRPGAY